MKYYINKYKIYQDTPDFDSLLNADTFHSYTVTDTNVFDLNIFMTKELIQWNNEVNKFGGVYKHRWGDHELNGLFWVIHFDKPFFNYDLVNQGYLDPGGLRHIQNYTPGVKNLWK